MQRQQRRAFKFNECKREETGFMIRNAGELHGHKKKREAMKYQHCVFEAFSRRGACALSFV